jgi:hypothetical protein
MTDFRIQLISSLEIRMPRGKGNLRGQLEGRRQPLSFPKGPVFETDPEVANVFHSMTGLQHIHILQPATHNHLREFMIYAQSICSLQLAVPRAEVTGTFVAMEVGRGIFWTHSLESGREMCHEERVDQIHEAMKALFETKKE